MAAAFFGIKGARYPIAIVYRHERNIVDLYIILVRFSSLVSETIPLHRDYRALQPKEKTRYRKKLLNVIDELESLKPEFQRRVEELNRGHAGLQLVERDGEDRTRYTTEVASLNWSSDIGSSFSAADKQIDSTSPSLWRYRNDHSQIVSSVPVQLDKQFQKISISFPVPRKETLSRHSILGPNGLRGQWLGPSADIKVHYPISLDYTPTEDLCQPANFDAPAVKDASEGTAGTTMESVLSLDDGRWMHPAGESIHASMNEAREDLFKHVSLRQPSPPPVLARLQKGSAAIPPSLVADPRPGPAKPSQPTSDSYQHLHVPVNMMEDFLRLACGNTTKNLETCGILAGSLKNRLFQITTLIIPKQESTSDSCQTINEEEIFEVQDRLSLFPLGWIHTHPSQTCFMSSVDLHTHYSYQIMLPEAIAIVMAPTDESSPHGIFHLSDPSGVNVIRNCQERGFHPHEEPSDGTPIYEHCSHVFFNTRLKRLPLSLVVSKSGSRSSCGSGPARGRRSAGICTSSLSTLTEGRRRREDNLVEIRKSKCEESLLKKRREALHSQKPPSSAFFRAPDVERKLESLPQMVAGVRSDNAALQLEATSQFRKLLSVERTPPIQEIIQSGVVPCFVEFLMREEFPQLQFEAAWALTNIASGTLESTKAVIDSGAVPIFVKLLASHSDDVREQAVWALGNIAGDSPNCRDLVLGHGALITLLAQLNEHANLSMLRNATWTLSNFCRGKPQPPFEQVRPALPALGRLLHASDEEVLTDVCWTLSYLSDGTNDKIQAVIESSFPFCSHSCTPHDWEYCNRR
ncbi:hypothetical protein SAY87_028178 [Trapa incisa]|uniref:MPN domain-containing protein n=1 Tax=Trapa incisa TaxID=236973 RepID=A0AAN7KXD1_9MYRT|nr:hypothetical protein SAY87_028178 [Trapa incisa]